VAGRAPAAQRQKFVWPRGAGAALMLTRAQLDALVLGLPWQRIEGAGVITVL
jgi:transposase